jgi:DNA-binding IclR family transcriptional regulator
MVASQLRIGQTKFTVGNSQSNGHMACRDRGQTLTGDQPHSNSAARAISIIEFMAAHQTETFTISELARRLSLNKSTVHTLVHTLHEAGWLFCSTVDLRYGLGPTLTILGEAAAQAIPELTLARSAMEELAAEFQRECVFSMVADGEIISLYTTGPAGLRGNWVRPGARTPCNPPFGTVFMAWEGDAARKAWYERGRVSDPQRYEELNADLAAIRKRGYVVTVKSTFEAKLAQVMRTMPDAFVSRRELHDILERHLADLQPVEYLVSDDDGGGSLLVETIQAPVFESEVPRYAITVSHIDRVLDPAGLARAGKRVRDAADGVSELIADLTKSSRLRSKL